MCGTFAQETFAYYAPEGGQFISRDPIGYDAGDANQYRYVGNQSPNGGDEVGLVETFQNHHPYPLYLGGSGSQSLLELPTTQHKIATKYFATRFPVGGKGAAMWGEMSALRQQAHIARSLRLAGVSRDVIRTHMADFMAGANPGIKTPRAATGNLIKWAGGIPLSVATIMLTPSIADAAVVPRPRWYVPPCTKAECRCAEYSYILTVTSSWASLGDLVRGGVNSIAKDTLSSPWESLGEMSMQDCADMETGLGCVKMESFWGYTIYQCSYFLCTFGGE
jgi:hypothetical protein